MVTVRELNNVTQLKEVGLSQFGEVFTQRWVAELILDSVGYTTDQDLGSRKLVEPACGCGAFLVPIVERLVESARRCGHRVSDLAEAISAYDVQADNAEIARKAVVQVLVQGGEELATAEAVAERWVTTDDFLASDPIADFADYVVGNPPYVRLEDVPVKTTSEYRDRWTTMRGRSDLYVGFFEKGLMLLKDGGRLGFICADRWMRNRYGSRLREMVSEEFAVETVIFMHDVDAFENEVSAYPAITVLQRAEQGPAVLVEATERFGSSDGAVLSEWIRNGPVDSMPSGRSFNVGIIPTWFKGRGLWPTGTPQQLELIAHLEDKFDPLESAATGTRVGIGVATGCDEVFIRQQPPEDVDSDRLLPLLTTRDLAPDGKIAWRGNHLVNPWDEEGLVDLDDHEGLATYYARHERKLRARHIGRKNPDRWYRTIDRVHPDLQTTAKLVLPDIKSAAEPVLDTGRYYPHHNLYYITSDGWDLRVLGGLLLSAVTDLLVGAYCVKMRGGTYRFQAQYLRMIRLPDPAAVKSEAKHLRRAFSTRDRELATEAACRAYGIERQDLGAD
jgi:tRNA1(Val) A37 N6-methylase TrmN6